MRLYKLVYTPWFSSDDMLSVGTSNTKSMRLVPNVMSSFCHF